jgi:hypothetical protein
MVILSADGTKLATSDREGAEGNIGFPSTAAGRAHFEQMLRTTAMKLTDDEIAALLSGLEDR